MHVAHLMGQSILIFQGRYKIIKGIPLRAKKFDRINRIYMIFFAFPDERQKEIIVL
jgi:hypothetical protein